MIVNNKARNVCVVVDDGPSGTSPPQAACAPSDRGRA